MPAQSTYKPVVPRSIGETLGSTGDGQDSPVMNETLHVIDEHITDLSTPRHSRAPRQSIPDDSESEYSSHLDRLSTFLTGPETDDEENGRLSKEEVMKWDHKQAASHLRNLGVDPKHCDIFEEQEITGEVLLDMDQSFLQMKEFDFGVMGKRLKTWHKIRDFQQEVRGQKSTRQSSVGIRTAGSMDDLNRTQSRGMTGSTILPRIPSLREEPGLNIRMSQHGHPTSPVSVIPPPLQMQQPTNGLTRTSFGTGTPPPNWRSSVGPDSPARPSAASIRELTHSRRHSSIDLNNKPNTGLSSGSFATASTPQKTKSSFDQDWAGGSLTPASTNITSPSMNNVVKKQESFEMSANSPLLTDGPNLDLDRGYFSGNEVDNRKRNVLKKRDSDSPAHSRQSSLLDEPRKPTSAVKRHSRLSSVDSIRDVTGSMISPASKAYHSASYKGRYRSASARSPSMRISGGYSPTVTNLEDEQPSVTASSGTNSISRMSIPNKARKLMGIRAASEAVTTQEKDIVTSPRIMHGTLEESPEASPVGSHTPSVTEQSAEVDNTDTSSKGTDQVGSTLSLRTSQRSRPKNKQQTSAYTKGLLKISPEEARQHCDYHGWMKKKSSSLMTTWKPRLFILRGRRLSYYYSENDTEERGIIDISGHKVLVANSDPITTLHATITGAAASPSVASSSDTSPNISKMPGSGGLFYFKLVPPKAGLSRAVQFTKPTIHYFQVDSTILGRKWMGEIMKATIEHDLSRLETTNKQKTISLAKARAQKQRPPFLKNVEEINEKAVEENQQKESGLNISGLDLGESESKTPDAVQPAIEPEKEAVAST